MNNIKPINQTRLFGLDIIINVVSSLANSGLTLVKLDNNLSLYFLLII